MSDHESLADLAVRTLAAVSDMGNVASDDPLRHSIRNLRQCAQTAILNGLQEALRISEVTTQLRIDVRAALEGQP